MSERLALVPKPDAQRVVDVCRESGAYDADRRVREYDADTVAVPVTRDVECDLVAAVVADDDPEPRRRGLDDLLRERGFTEADVERAPSSWAVVGDVVLVAFGDCERRAAVGEALLELHGAETVLARGGIEGPHREPDVEVVAGSGETETVHVEHGTTYGLDLAAVMFSPGNKAERARMGEVTGPGEHVLDAFAGVGYFALPAARAGARVTAVERNPTAFRYLVENAERNGVADRLTPVLGDCRDVVARRSPALDRLVLGYYDAPDYLDALLGALRPGGVVHLHATAHAEDPYGPPAAALRETTAAVEVESCRVVKSHGPGVCHVVVDATCWPPD